MIIKQNSGFKFVELYVGMGKMVAWWHRYALGFNIKGKKIQKGVHGEEVSYWLQKGQANMIITSALEPAAHDVVSFVDRHGNSIKRFGVEVEDIELSLNHLVNSKAILLSNGIEDLVIGEEHSRIIRYKLFDDNEIMLVQTIRSTGPLPGFILTEDEVENTEASILAIDHLASVVRVNESEYWNTYLSSTLQLDHVQTIGEEFFANLRTGMKMNVFHSSHSKINKVIVEPLPEKTRKSQVDVFLQHHLGTGIQHMAFEVSDLITVVSSFRSRGVTFTQVPEAYYTEIEKEFPDLPIALMKESNILCERDGDKILLQVFTEPVGDRPTLFYEFIQRVNDYDGFGVKNVHQLFKSLEIQLNGDA